VRATIGHRPLETAFIMKLKHISTDPSFAAAKAEYEAMGAALGKVNSRIAELEALLRSYAPDPDEAHVEAALEFAETGKVRAMQHISVLQDEHVALRTMREKVSASMTARAMALQTIEGELSAAVCRGLEVDHRKLAGRALEALKAIDALVQEEDEMIRAAESAGYRVNFREYVRWPYLGTLSMGSSEAPIWSRARELQNYAL
jgi:hypothetical protein